MFLPFSQPFRQTALDNLALVGGDKLELLALGLAAGGLVDALGLRLALALVVAHGVHDEREERGNKKAERARAFCLWRNIFFGMFIKSFLLMSHSYFEDMTF